MDERITRERFEALWVWLAAPSASAGVVTIASVIPARGALMTSPLTIMREDT